MDIKHNPEVPTGNISIISKDGEVEASDPSRVFGYCTFNQEDIQEVQLPDLSVQSIALLARIKAEPDVSMGSFYDEQGYERGYNPLELFGSEETFTHLRHIAEGKITSGKVVEKLEVLISKFSALPFHGAAELAADCLLDSLEEFSVES